MTAGAHLLLVEDERSIREPLARLLEREGFRVTQAGDAERARLLLPDSKFDLAILDIMLPGEDGLSLARFIRASGDLPLIMLTARSEEIDRIIGIEMGADDYLAKPFNPRELIARIRAILRRAGPRAAVAPASGGYCFGPWRLDPEAQRVRHDDGHDADLTSGEYRLLLALVERPGRVLSRDQLLDLAHGRGPEGLDRAIDNMVHRLRRRIEVDPSEPEWIRTVHGSGYLFAGKVETLCAD